MKKIKYTLILIGALIMNTVISDTDFTHPLYSLEFKIYGTGAEIRLNDIPVLIHTADGQTSSQKPIPESVINGKNILSIKSFPLNADDNKYQAGAYIQAIISVREKDGPIKNSQPLLQLKINPTNNENKVLEGTIEEYGNKDFTLLNHSEKESVAQRTAEITTPFPRWAWQDGNNIDNTEENFNSLLNVYNEIWDSLNQGNIEKVKSLYSPAAKEFAVANHYSNPDEGHRIINTGGLINDDEWMLADISKLKTQMKYKLNIYGNGKLAQIIDQDNRTPIIYLNKKVKMLNIQKFGFYKNKNGEWIMIR